MERPVVISLGGSIIVPGSVDIVFLKKFRQFILKQARKRKIVIVCGGGRTARIYGKAAREIVKVKSFDLDLVGIRATKLNAELVRVLLGNLAHKYVIENPTKKVRTDKNIIVASGWVPGFSSDMDAVLLAKNVGADTVVNLSNIEFVYDKDPKKFRSAKKIESISWGGFQKIVGTKWVAGASFPFDPEASKMAKRLRLKVVVAYGKDLNNLRNIFENKKFKGTVIG